MHLLEERHAVIAFNWHGLRARIAFRGQGLGGGRDVRASTRDVNGADSVRHGLSLVLLLCQAFDGTAAAAA